MKLGNAAGSGIVFLGPRKIPSVFHDYQHPADEALVKRLAAEQNWEAAFEELARSLHEALYIAQSFKFLGALYPLEQLILSLDYAQMQIGQGGFIQLFQNGYGPLLVTVIESAQTLGMSPSICKTLDDALKIYVLNNEALGRETTPEEFSKLYQEFQEFEPLDKTFEEELPLLVQQVVLHSIAE